MSSVVVVLIRETLLGTGWRKPTAPLRCSPHGRFFIKTVLNDGGF